MYPTLTYIDFHKEMHSVKALNCCETFVGQIVVVLLFNVHGKHLRSCPDGQLT